MYRVWYGIVIDQYNFFVFMQKIIALWGLQTGAETIKVWWLSSPQRNWLSNDIIPQLWIFKAFGIGGRKWVTKSSSHWSRVKSEVAWWLDLAERNLTWQWLLLLLDFDLSWSASWLDLKWVFYLSSLSQYAMNDMYGPESGYYDGRTGLLGTVTKPCC